MTCIIIVVQRIYKLTMQGYYVIGSFTPQSKGISQAAY